MEFSTSSTTTSNMIDDLLNSTKNISIHTVTARLLQEHQISAAFLITTGIAILFFGHSVWSFSRKNILVPLVICVLVLLFRPDLNTFSNQIPQFSKYVPCIQKNACTWEYNAFEIGWLILAISTSVLLNRHTKKGEQVIVALLSCAIGSMTMGTFAKFLFRQLVDVRELLCDAVTKKECNIDNEADEKIIAFVTLLFGGIGVVLLVPRALRFYKTMLRAILSLVGAIFITTGFTILVFVHGYNESTPISYLSMWMGAVVIVTPALAFWGFVWQETSHAKHVNRLLENQDSDDDNSGGRRNTSSSDMDDDDRNDDELGFNIDSNPSDYLYTPGRAGNNIQRRKRSKTPRKNIFKINSF